MNLHLKKINFIVKKNNKKKLQELKIQAELNSKETEVMHSLRKKNSQSIFSTVNKQTNIAVLQGRTVESVQFNRGSVLYFFLTQESYKIKIVMHGVKGGGSRHWGMGRAFNHHEKFFANFSLSFNCFKSLRKNKCYCQFVCLFIFFQNPRR